MAVKLESGDLVLSCGTRVPLPAGAEVVPRSGGDAAVLVERAGVRRGLIFPAGTPPAAAREMVRLIDRRG